ncbi:MAG: 4Fe-4S dicluster domain-containing protein, partial [Verrucomicrobiota bacterium]
DPDRAMRFTRAGGDVSKEAAFDFLAELSKKFQGSNGAGLNFLVERSSSPSRERLQKVISQKFPKARWFIYEPIDLEVGQQAASIAFGQSVKPQYHLEKAKRILSLDCDFIGAEEDTYRSIRDFARGRKLVGPQSDMSRLYVVEALFTLTGANADHRLRVPASQVLAVAARIAVEISSNVSSEVSALAKSFTGNEKWIQECAKDLRAQGKSSLVLAGHRQPLAVHLIANAINDALGSIGETVVFHAAPDNKEGSISDLAAALNAGAVDTLVVLGGNAAYNAPADLDWARTQAKAKTILRAGYYEDESFSEDKSFTGEKWHFPQAHYLESWGDARTSDGTLVSVQPLISPLFDGVTEIEILARIAGEKNISPYDIVRETFNGLSKGGDEAWKKFLHDGYLANSAAQSVPVKLGSISSAFQNISPAPTPTAQSLEVIFHRDYKVDDGRYNNNGWLQELPDPVTKMTWENVILLSEKTAKDLGLIIVNHEDNRLKVPWVKIQLNGREVEGPAWIQPGQADHTIGLALGYGREKTGRIGHGSGYNAYKIRTASALYFASGAKLTPTGKIHPLSTTQDHGSMEGRPIIREANLEQFKKNPAFAKSMDLEAPPSKQPLYPNPLDQRKAAGLHQWGMSIDLNSCVGCSACMVACQSENNVPIVGKEQVSNNREMHWLRIDRYFTGGISDPQMITQPMLCQHCEAAPCESVCPVNATSHDDEGLNVMTYNRCVGTRYCSNNCPYKVRRFNFFDYNKRPLAELYKGPLARRPQDELDLIKLLKNPDVTVRMRGVMEKCSFCLQRIEGAKIAQKVKAGASDDVVVPEGTFTTACAQA